MDINYDLEVSKEDELLLRNHWKLVSTCQFLNMFKNVLKLRDPVTPYDLEQSLLRPQHDPLCAELMSRLLQKKIFKKDAPIQPAASEQSTFNSNLDYDQWNMLLAKRFSMMYKNYRKFAIKFLGKDPLLLLQDKPTASQQEEMAMLEDNPVDLTQVLAAEEVKEEVKDQVPDSSQLPSEEQQQPNQLKVPVVEETKERVTRSRVKKAENGQPDSQNSTKPKESKKPQVVQTAKEPEIVLPEQLWSSEIRDHLLVYDDKNTLIKFAHMSSNQWKTELLQTMKLFNEELEGLDPFYIEGQEWVQQGAKDDQSNFYSNFIDTDNIEDFDDYSALQGYGQKIEVQFNRFHEISTKNRLDILFFLCQNKLDSEQPDFMQEVSALSLSKPPKPEPSEDGLPPKLSDEIKYFLEPVNLGLLKPLGTLTEDLVDAQAGHYFYFPYFSDTRIYHQAMDLSTFELVLEDFDQIQIFLETLKVQELREDCQELHDRLSKYMEQLKKFSEEMKWKEASKVRKLKSQIRSRRLKDMSRKKLQFEGRAHQIQTDMLHHAQGKVMTRKQVDTLKAKITKTPAAQKEEQKKELAVNRFAEQQKEKYAKEKQDRQRRLEKRMQVKEGGSRKRLGKRGRDSEQEYYDEEDYGQEEQYQEDVAQGEQITKRVKKGQPEAPPQQDYEIVLSGHLLMIYQRDPDDGQKITNFNMVIKGKWKLSVEEQSEDFIYKKIELPVQEELMTELFCEKESDRIRIPNHQAISNFIVGNYQSVLDKFFECQGFYNGYFKYNDDEVTEKFSFILRKPKQSKKMNVYDMCGYGENDIGPFIMEGQMQMLDLEKIQEKNGVKDFKKIKLGKFTLKKNYKQKILEELVEQAQDQRQEQKRLLMEMNPRGLMMSATKSIQSQDIAYSQHSQMSQQTLPKLSTMPMNLSQSGHMQFQTIQRGMPTMESPLHQLLHQQQTLLRPPVQPSLPFMTQQMPQQNLPFQINKVTPDFNQMLATQLMQGQQIIDPSKTFPLQGIFQTMQQPSEPLNQQLLPGMPTLQNIHQQLGATNPAASLLLMQQINRQMQQQSQQMNDQRGWNNNPGNNNQ